MMCVISERGNGLPTAGDYVPGNGELYRVIKIVGPIQTGQPGEGNWVRAEVEAADWEDCDEGDEFPASVEVEET